MKNSRTVGITGASGTLGKELTKLFRKKGYKVIEGVKEYQFNLEQIDGNEVSKKNTLIT